MKKIEAIVRRSKLNDIKEFLSNSGINTITVSYAIGCGKQRRIEIYRGIKHTITMIAKVKIETVIPDEQTDTVVNALARIAKSGEIGDGKIVISPIECA